MFIPVYFQFNKQNSALDKAFASHIPSFNIQALPLGIHINGLNQHTPLSIELETKYKLIDKLSHCKKVTDTAFEDFANIIYSLVDAKAAFGENIDSTIDTYNFLISFCQDMLDANISNAEREVVSDLYRSAISWYANDITNLSFSKNSNKSDLMVELIYDNINAYLEDDETEGAIWIDLKDQWDGQNITSRITSDIRGFIPYNTANDYEHLFNNGVSTKPVFDLSFHPAYKILDSYEMLNLINANIKNYEFARYQNYYYKID